MSGDEDRIPIIITILFCPWLLMLVSWVMFSHQEDYHWPGFDEILSFADHDHELCQIAL